ncbi:metallophosphoesterase [Flavobacterium sp.]|uniref:metallophosphoesterase n=1 Tax=Flavobacterium sp. TaxID=239 RepID=UPI003526E907
MNFFSIHFVSKSFLQRIVLLFFIGFLTGCTTYKTQLGSQATSFYNNQSLDTTTIVYSVFLTGNAANTQNDGATPSLSNFKKRLEKASKNSTVLFLGDNIFPLNGFNQNKTKAEEKITTQLNLTEKFKGKVFLIPGKSDWGNSTSSLLAQENFISKYKKKESQLIPQNACGIEFVSLSNEVELVSINSQWFLDDWNEHTEINKGCSIKTREQFFDELDSHLLENQEKTILLAIHHPLLSNGIYGGQYSLNQQLFPLEKNIPLPIAGSFYNLFRKASGYKTNDLQHASYREMTERIKSIVQKYNHVVVVSGHEQNLQYINKEGIKQVISGSGAYFSEARAVNPKDFSYGGYGYAVIDVYENGASTVSFYTTSNRKEGLLFRQKIREPELNIKHQQYPKQFEPTVKKSIFGKPVSRKSDVYQFLWGKHYKNYYKKEIALRTVSLDTLYGGLKPIGLDNEGTTNSLLLKDKNGKEFSMQPLEKDASSFFKSLAYKNSNLKNQEKNALSEDFLRDYFTTIHPFTPLVVSKLSLAIGISSPHSKLFYVPNQNALGNYNEDFGGSLYYISEKVNTTQKSLADFGKPNAIIDTDEMLHQIRIDKNHVVDKENYIRARLLDMLIGDWDRQEKNWRWSVHQEKEKTIYRPIPLNRDQAFAKYDGAFLWLLKSIPAMGQMHSYTYNPKNIKEFNKQVYALDLALLSDSDEKVWEKQAKFIQDNLTNDVINKAFLQLPYELQDETTTKLKLYLRNRLKKLNQTAQQYQNLLNKKTLVVGTMKDDVFVINRLSNGRTSVVVYNGKKTPSNIVFEKTFTKKRTKEIWFFGLEGKDEFSMEGNEFNPIKIRLIGGLNQDSYIIENGKKVKIHDFKTNNILNVDKKTTVLLSNDYETNTYNYNKPNFDEFTGVPLVGFNPDDGIRLGVRLDFTKKGYLGNPYSQKHTADANYFFATKGYELTYSGIIKRAFSHFDMVINAQATSSNFAQNFFGFGNNTQNEADEFDFNRVRIASYKVSPGLLWQKTKSSSFIGRINFEAYKVEDTPNRFISSGVVDNRVFSYQNFAGVGLTYQFKNYDNPFIPSLGMGLQVIGKWNTNLTDFSKQVPSAEVVANFVYRLTPDAQWIFETTLKGKSLFSDTYEFYQAANLGGDSDLRGFRDNRFSGKTAAFQGSDLRYSIGQIKNPFAPMNYGAFIGFDYGRVWFPGENNSKWHQSTGFGLWLNSSNVISSTISYFHSSDGGRIAFGMKFNF